MNTHTMLAGLATTALLAACSTNNPTPTERSFGDSVRNMIEAQTYDPSTRSSPSTETVDSSDGRRLEAVLDVYRTDVAKPDTVGDEIVINVDGQ
jgi:hypothetical protein